MPAFRILATLAVFGVAQAFIDGYNGHIHHHQRAAPLSAPLGNVSLHRDKGHHYDQLPGPVVIHDAVRAFLSNIDDLGNFYTHPNGDGVSTQQGMALLTSLYYDPRISLRPPAKRALLVGKELSRESKLLLTAHEPVAVGGNYAGYGGYGGGYVEPTPPDLAHLRGELKEKLAKIRAYWHTIKPSTLNEMAKNGMLRRSDRGGAAGLADVKMGWFGL